MCLRGREREGGGKKQEETATNKQAAAADSLSPEFKTFYFALSFKFQWVTLRSKWLFVNI